MIADKFADKFFVNVLMVFYLTIFHFYVAIFQKYLNCFRGRSSAGRAPALQAGGRRFDPVRLHHLWLSSSLKNNVLQ